MYQATLDGRQSLTDQAYVRLEELIVTLQLEPGAVLSESVLSRDLGFGRTPIREALQRLAREGLVTILPRKGVLVSEVNPGICPRIARRSLCAGRASSLPVCSSTRASLSSCRVSSRRIRS